MSDKKRRPSTIVVEGGRRKEWRGPLVNVPIERASTLLFESVADLEGSRPRLGTYRYGLQGTATQWALAEALTELELLQIHPDAAVIPRIGPGAAVRPDVRCLRLGHLTLPDHVSDIIVNLFS